MGRRPRWSLLGTRPGGQATRPPGQAASPPAGAQPWGFSLSNWPPWVAAGAAGAGGSCPLSTGPPDQGLCPGPRKALPRDNLEAASSDHFLVEAVTSWGRGGSCLQTAHSQWALPSPAPGGAPTQCQLFWARPCWVTGCLTLGGQTHNPS